MNSTPELFEYGIQTEKSDIRAHVAVLARRVLVFRTAVAVPLVLSGKYRTVPAYQPGVIGKTAIGTPIPIDDIPDVRTLNFASYDWTVFPSMSAGTSQKGAAAVAVVCELLRRGRFPLWIESTEDSRQSIQISGADVIVFAKQRIQVKCDWAAGRKEWHPQCSGNVFLQTMERNPLKRI